jgi:hypothetical protein
MASSSGSLEKGSFVAAQLPALERLSSREAAPRSRRAGHSCIGSVLPAFSPALEIGLLEGVEARTAEQDERAMGRLAVDLLVAQVEDDAVPPVATILT